MASSYRAGKSGLAAESQRKIESNFDAEEAKKCLEWIQIISGTDKIPSNPADIDATHDSFHEVLKDGMVLSQLMDKLIPGSINWKARTFSQPKIPAMAVMMERERIANFTTLVTKFGVPEAFIFPTESLHEKGALNLSQVCTCIRALGIEAQRKPGYGGPSGFWPKKADTNKREFSEEQLKAGEGVIGLQMGSNRGASQAGMTMGKQRMIID